MYFITVDVNGYVTGMYDGSKDYVHRVTGEPIAGASRIPDTAIKLSPLCTEKYLNKTPNQKVRYVDGCLTLEEVSGTAEKREILSVELPAQLATAEKERVLGLTDVEIETLWSTIWL